jgi:hypothetical protein
MSIYFLKVSSKLLPLRIACSGGKYHIYDYSDDDEENGDGDGDAEDVVDEQNVDGNGGEKGEGKVKKKKSKETVYSKFSFNTKFNILLEELQKIRDKEPDCKCFLSILVWFFILKSSPLKTNNEFFCLFQFTHSSYFTSTLLQPNLLFSLNSVQL